jgi:hypothetical protein
LKHWKNWVRVLTLVFVGAYTILSYCQLKLSENTARRQLRAYVGWTGNNVNLRCLSCGIPAKTTEKADDITTDNTVSIEIQNFGLTPAYDLQFWMNFWSIPFNAELPKDFNFPKPVGVSETNSDDIINPGQKIPIFGFLQIADIDKVTKAHNRESSLYLYGEIQFRDAFGWNRIVPYCFQYRPDVQQNSFATCRHHMVAVDK